MSRLGLILTALIGLFLMPLKTLAMASIWQVDSGYSYIKFTIGNVGFTTCHGVLNSFYGRVDYKPNDLSTIKVKVEMEPDTVQTGIEKRDNHLKGKSFFNVGKYPIWTFTSTRIEPISPAHFKMTGLLSIKGIEKEVTLDCHGPTQMRTTQTGEKASFTAVAETKVDRRQFGVTGWGGIIGDVAKITVRIRAVESTESEAEEEFRKHSKAREKAAADNKKNADAQAARKRF